MTRLSTANQAALENSAPVWILFVEIHSDPAYFFHNGIGRLVVGSKTYLGVGHVGNIDGVSDNMEITHSPVTFTVSPVDPSVLGTFLDEQLSGVRVDVLAGVAQGGALVDDPNCIYSGDITEITISITPGDDGNKRGIIQFSADQEWANWDRKHTALMSHASHLQKHPGDMFFENNAAAGAYQWAPGVVRVNSQRRLSRSGGV